MSIWSEYAYVTNELTEYIKNPLLNGVSNTLFGTPQYLSYAGYPFSWDSVNGKFDETPTVLFDISGTGSMDSAITLFNNLYGVRTIFYRLTIEIDGEILYRDDGVSSKGYTFYTSGIKGVLQPDNLSTASTTSTGSNVHVNHIGDKSSYFAYTTRESYLARQKPIVSQLFPYTNPYTNNETTLLVPAPLHFNESVKVSVNLISGVSGSYEIQGGETSGRIFAYCDLTLN